MNELFELRLIHGINSSWRNNMSIIKFSKLGLDETIGQGKFS